MEDRKGISGKRRLTIAECDAMRSRTNFKISLAILKHYLTTLAEP